MKLVFSQQEIEEIVAEHCLRMFDQQTNALVPVEWDHEVRASLIDGRKSSKTMLTVELEMP